MIRVVEGTPGAGKTCLVLEWLLREVDRGFYKEFYSNIANLRVCGVRHIDPDFDWRTLNPLKEGSTTEHVKSHPILVIFDEAQYEAAFMKENRSNNPIGKDLSTHRHYGIDMWLVTQSSTLLNSYVHANTGEHVFLYRPRKKKSVKVYWWSHIQKSLSKEAFKGADDEQTWRLNPHMFDLYRSTSGVTDGEARKSTKLFSILMTAVLVFGFIGFMVKQGLSSFEQMRTGVDGSQDVKVLTVDPAKIAGELSTGQGDLSTDLPTGQGDLSTDLPTVEQAAMLADVDAIVVGAALVDGQCWAYNGKALRVPMSQSDCAVFLPVFVESDAVAGVVR